MEPVLDLTNKVRVSAWNMEESQAELPVAAQKLWIGLSRRRPVGLKEALPVKKGKPGDRKVEQPGTWGASHGASSEISLILHPV